MSSKFGSFTQSNLGALIQSSLGNARGVGDYGFIYTRNISLSNYRVTKYKNGVNTYMSSQNLEAIDITEFDGKLWIVCPDGVYYWDSGASSFVKDLSITAGGIVDSMFFEFDNKLGVTIGNSTFVDGSGASRTGVAYRTSGGSWYTYDAGAGASIQFASEALNTVTFAGVVTGNNSELYLSGDNYSWSTLLWDGSSFDDNPQGSGILTDGPSNNIYSVIPDGSGRLYHFGEHVNTNANPPFIDDTGCYRANGIGSGSSQVIINNCTDAIEYDGTIYAMSGNLYTISGLNVTLDASLGEAGGKFAVSTGDNPELYVSTWSSISKYTGSAFEQILANVFSGSSFRGLYFPSKDY